MEFRKMVMITLYAAVAAKLLQSCPTLCNPIDGDPPGSLVPGILQARTLEWVAIHFSRGISRPRDRIRVSPIAGRFFTTELTHLCVSPFFNCFVSKHILKRAVLMRWMKLEPIIQSEVGQKEKHQYSILTHVYGI